MLAQPNHLPSGTGAHAPGAAILLRSSALGRLGTPVTQFAQLAPLSEVQTLVFNDALAERLGLDASPATQQYLLALANGAALPDGVVPVAQDYGGHSFGYYHPKLGDGRAAILGDLADREGKLWELQVKGSGTTPVSRAPLSGRLATSAAVREYLGSEFLAAIGVPTSRTLAVFRSNQPVYEVHGNGPRYEPGALLVRVMPSHVRFGTFEFLYHAGHRQHIGALADHAIDRAFPHLHARPDRYLGLLAEATRATGEMIAGWDAAGFVHGVMNTDNFAVCGATLDFGPFAFIDDYDPDFTAFEGDLNHRYKLGAQAAIGRWNLECFAHTLTTLISAQAAKSVLQDYEDLYLQAYLRQMALRLGVEYQSGERLRGLVDDLRQLLQQDDVDYHCALTQLGAAQPQVPEAGGAHAAAWRAWLERLGQLRREAGPRREPVVPRLVPRTWAIERACEGMAQGDFEPYQQLANALQQPFQSCSPFSERPAREHRNRAVDR